MSGGTKFLTNWRTVDDTEGAKDFPTYLRLIDQLGPTARMREQSYQILEGTSGPGVDVGSGNGRVVHELSQRGLSAVGVDLSQTMVDTAREQFPECAFRQGSAYELPFEHQSLHWYRAERVYHQLTDIEAALSEARRVLKSGSPIVLLAPDSYATRFTTSEVHAKLSREVISSVAQLIPHPDFALQSAQALLNAGFVDVTVRPYLLRFTDLAEARMAILDMSIDGAIGMGMLSHEQADRLYEDMQTLDDRGVFASNMTIYLAQAVRP